MRWDPVSHVAPTEAAWDLSDPQGMDAQYLQGRHACLLLKPYSLEKRTALELAPRAGEW